MLDRSQEPLESLWEPYLGNPIRSMGARVVLDDIATVGNDSIGFAEISSQARRRYSYVKAA